MTEAARRLDDQSCGGILVATDGRPLPLKEMRLVADARGGLARVRVEQRFANPYDDPLAVTYQLPLPEDGAVSGFAFQIGGRRIVGEVDRRAAARERFEQALLDGRSAGLLEQERGSLFTQELGNIPPHTEVVAEVVVDQRLRWLDEGAWEWRFPTVAAPRYLGAKGRVADAPRTSVDVASGPLDARLHVALRVGDVLAPEARIESPSHPIATTASDGGGGAITLADGAGAPLDRDVVVRWAVATPKVGIALERGRPASTKRWLDPSSFGLLTIVPPRADDAPAALPRDLIVLLDTSGSMSGAPLTQAKRVVCALIDSLSEKDQLELISFSTEPQRWQPQALAATPKVRRDAIAWVRSLKAGGGTEMRSGILEALAPLREGSQRQVALVTDGEVGFEREIVGTILRRLPAASRLHTVGIGSAVNRSLTTPAARAGRGVEIIVGLGEDVERPVARLIARTRAPMVTELAIAGTAVKALAPERPPDLYSGAPVQLAVELDPGGGELRVGGRTATGRWEQVLSVPATKAGEGFEPVAALFAREKVEDLETASAARPSDKCDAEIEAVGLKFQIATRLTSWIAVSEEPAVDPSAPTRRVKMPQMLPHGISAEGLGLRAAMATPVCLQVCRPEFVGSFRALESCAPMAPPPPEAQAPTRKMLSGGEARPRSQMPRPPRGPMQDRTSTPGPRRLRGTVRSQSEKQLVVEIEVDADLAWEVAKEAQIVWADGNSVKATVDRKRSTGKGRVSAGQIVRLVLTLSKVPSAQPVRIEFGCAGVPMDIDLQP